MSGPSGFWTRRDILEFFRLYKQHECLWRTKDKDYHNRQVKESAYQKLLQLVHRFDPDANLLSVTRKINNFRTSFRKERKKVLKSKRNGGPVYVPKLWYYNELQFLLDQKQESDGSDKDENSEDEIDDSGAKIKYEESMSSIASDHDFLEGCKGQSSSFMEQGMVDVTPSLESTQTQTYDFPGEGTKGRLPLGHVTQERVKSLRQEDEHDVFGKHVAHRLRNIPPDQVKYALKLISDVLFEADMESLNRSCKIVGTQEPK